MSCKLADNALTTLDTALAELGYVTGDDPTIDALVARYINVASDLFVHLTGRSFAREDGHVEKIGQPYGEKTLTVSDLLPVLSIDSIALDGEVVDSDLYQLDDSDLGWIRYLKGTWESSTWYKRGINRYPQDDLPSYEVTYDGGYVTPHQVDEGTYPTRTLPWDVEDAILSYVSYRFSRQGDDTTVASKSTGQWSVSYFQGVEMPSIFKNAVKRYRLTSVI